MPHRQKTHFEYGPYVMHFLEKVMRKLLIPLVAAILSLSLAQWSFAKDEKAPAKAAPAAEKKADAKTEAKAEEKLDLNSATEKQLMTLDGIGEARAKAIIKGRPYKSKDELVTKKILTDVVYEPIKEKIIAKQSPKK